MGHGGYIIGANLKRISLTAYCAETGASYEAYGRNAVGRPMMWPSNARNVTKTDRLKSGPLC